MKTAYEFWFEKQAEHGTFVTTLFEAYKAADMFNQIRLNKAFPELFIQRHERPYSARLENDLNKKGE